MSLLFDSHSEKAVSCMTKEKIIGKGGALCFTAVKKSCVP